jgi:uncharacterized protein
VERVRELACRLTDETAGRMFGVDKPVVELAALLHDARDHKYSSVSGDLDVRGLLLSLGCPLEWTDAICDIVDNIGFAAELAAGPDRATSIEFDLVSDADRLDAMGAIGVARCFSFGAVRGRMMCCPADLLGHDLPMPTAEEYKQGERGTTLQHFYEKLLKLSSMMRTDAGRRWAKSRHAFLESFVKQFVSECQFQT